MIIRRLSLIELNSLVDHQLKYYVTINDSEVSTIVEDYKGDEYRISAEFIDGRAIDINYDANSIDGAALDEFRDYLAELEDLYDEMMNILDPINDNDNYKR